MTRVPSNPPGLLRTEPVDRSLAPAGPRRLHISSALLRIFPLEANNYLIGRHPDCGIHIPDDPALSLRHARLFLDEEGQWSLRDASSSNGIAELDSGGRPTRRALPEIRRWQPWQRVMLGRSELWLEPIASPAERLSGFHGIVGEAPCMRELFGKLERGAPLPANVVLSGESGTGKTKIASVIHALSGRRGDFVVVDCASLSSSDLAHSELFGHKAGAFTGATKDRPGAFRAGRGGTVFLDEIGELELEAQKKLLRVLESRKARALGEDKEYEVDVRVIAATHRNLARDMHDGKFRQDLYYRLHVVDLRVPSLSERFLDIPLLVPALTAELGYEPREWSDEALAALMATELPGNVRELRNVVERALINAGASAKVELAHLGRQAASEATGPTPKLIPRGVEDDLNYVFLPGKKLDAVVAEVMRKGIQRHGTKVAAGEALGVSPATMTRFKDVGNAPLKPRARPVKAPRARGEPSSGSEGAGD